MDEELQHRFLQKKLQELLTDCTRPFPTYIFEMERPEIIELVREFCLYSTKMTAYKVDSDSFFVPEKLESKTVKDYGELYSLVVLS